MKPESAKLCVCHLVLSLDAGGLENGVVNLVNRLGEHGIDSHVLCIRRQGTLADRVSSDVPLVCLDYTEGFHLRGVLRIVKYLRTHNIHILHTRNRAALVWGGCVKLFHPGVKHIHSEHGTAVEGGRLAGWFGRRADGLLAVAPNLVEEMRELYRLPENRNIEVIPNGVDTELFQPMMGTSSAGDHGTIGPRDNGTSINGHDATPSPPRSTRGDSRKKLQGTQTFSSADRPEPQETGRKRAHKSQKGLREMLGLAPDTVLFGCVGRLDENKNQRLAIHAFSEMKDKMHENARKDNSLPGAQSYLQTDARTHQRTDAQILALLIIGDGPERENLQHLAKTCSLSVVGCEGDHEQARYRRTNAQTHQRTDAQAQEDIFFLGFRDDIPDLLPQLDVLLLPSRSEGMSNVILEAGACGVPVLASDIPANRRLITEGENGSLLPVETPKPPNLFNPSQHSSFQPSAVSLQPSDFSLQPSAVSLDKAIADWSQAMADLAANAKKRRQMGTAARELVTKEYSIKRMVKHYAAMYKVVRASSLHRCDNAGRFRSMN